MSRHGLSCPYCKSENLVPGADVFVEEGEFDPTTGEYDREGQAGSWVCKDCNCGFIEWTPEEGNA